VIAAIEGPNGAGKTTLTKAYSELHPDVLCRLCVPDIYMDCHDIKSYMLFEASALGSAFYFLSGLIEAKKEDERGHYSKILIDRSIWSTFAAAYAKDETSIIPLFKVVNDIKDFIHLPDKTIVLRASYETCIQRSGEKLIGKEFDNDSFIQFNKKLDFYSILKQRGYDVIFIETDKMTKNDVLSVFSNLLKW
jgi:thymidylate kinase